MIRPSLRSFLKDWFWGISLMGACLVAFSLVQIIIPEPCWWAAAMGCGVMVINSLLTWIIHARAIGRSRTVFLAWGVGVNSIRMLTLIVFFAYITQGFISERGSFLVAGISAFFVVMPAEILQLFKIQDKQREHL